MKFDFFVSKVFPTITFLLYVWEFDWFHNFGVFFTMCLLTFSSLQMFLATIKRLKKKKQEVYKKQQDELKVEDTIRNHSQVNGRKYSEYSLGGIFFFTGKLVFM